MGIAGGRCRVTKELLLLFGMQEGKYTIQQSSRGRFIGGEEAKDAETNLWSWEQTDRERERGGPSFYKEV